MATPKPKILIFDIECSKKISTHFENKNQWMYMNDELYDKRMISISWKWFGSSEHGAVSISPNKLYCDKKITQRLRSLLIEADMVVGYNSKYFDMRFFQSRLEYHDLAPIPDIPHFDLMRDAKKRKYEPYYSLAYILKKYKLGSKYKIDKDIWTYLTELAFLQLSGKQTDKETIADITKVLQTMEIYNLRDVKETEKLYKKDRKYSTTHPNMNVLARAKGLLCKVCGIGSLHSKGFRVTKTARYKRYVCTRCGAYTSSKTRTSGHDGR